MSRLTGTEAFLSAAAWIDMFLAHSSNERCSPEGQLKAFGRARPVALQCHHCIPWGGGQGLLCTPPSSSSSSPPCAPEAPASLSGSWYQGASTSRCRPWALWPSWHHGDSQHLRGCGLCSHTASHRCPHSSQGLQRTLQAFTFSSFDTWGSDGHSRVPKLERNRAGPLSPGPIQDSHSLTELLSLWTSQFLLWQRGSWEGSLEQKWGHSSKCRARTWGQESSALGLIWCNPSIGPRTWAHLITGRAKSSYWPQGTQFKCWGQIPVPLPPSSMVA